MAKGVKCMRFVLVALVALLSPIIANVQTSNPRSSSDSIPKIEVLEVRMNQSVDPHQFAIVLGWL